MSSEIAPCSEVLEMIDGVIDFAYFHGYHEHGYPLTREVRTCIASLQQQLADAREALRKCEKGGEHLAEMLRVSSQRIAELERVLAECLEVITAGPKRDASGCTTYYLAVIGPGTVERWRAAIGRGKPEPTSNMAFPGPCPVCYPTLAPAHRERYGVDSLPCAAHAAE